jgi:polyisoprenyl-teichoic acid--peptidoglycan teichoic acid transferase
VASVSFVPPKIETYDPDYDKIRAMVESALERAEAADEPTAAAGAGDRAQTGRQGRAHDAEQAGTGSSATSRPGTANQTAALSGAC